MTYEELKADWAEHCKIDPLNLNSSSLDGAYLHAKYSMILSDEKLKKVQLESQLNRLRLWKTQYYLGELPREQLIEFKWEPFAKKILRQELPLYLDADTDIIALILKIAMANEKAELCLNILRNLNSRPFVIKNTNDRDRLMNGG